MNLFRLNNHLVLTLDNGTQFQTSECTDEFAARVVANLNDEEALIELFNPSYAAAKSLTEKIIKSKILTLEGASVYMKDVSELTMPQDFAEKIIEAEEAGDQDKLTAYRNFWILLSLNPDSRVRNNLFWFLNKYGMVISKSGLFVGYRNADICTEGSVFNQELTRLITQVYWDLKTKQYADPHKYDVYKHNEGVSLVRNDVDNMQDQIDPEDVYLGELADLYNMLTSDSSDQTTVYTDHHSHTFRIRLGHIVSMPREKCDSVQENSCSTGLHVANLGWLKQNYFGNVGMKVLVNPADVVAVPPIDDYGKMRVCAYYPISIVNYDSCGNIIDDGIESGFEDDFINKICYHGTINNVDEDHYVLPIPDIGEIDKEQIYSRLREIASTYQREV